MTAALIAWPLTVLLAAAGLCALAPHDVPRITGTVAFICTLAALATAILR